MIRVILGFLGSLKDGPIVPLYIGHSGVDAQKAVDAAQGFAAVHIAELAHTRRAPRSPGLPPVSEPAPAVGASSSDSELTLLLEEADKENKKLKADLDGALGALAAAENVSAAKTEEIKSLKAKLAKLEKTVKLAGPAKPEESAPPVSEAPEASTAASETSSDPEQSVSGPTI